MLDDAVQLKQIYVAPTGSNVPNNAPNSADKPLPAFDLIITAEAGDGIVNNGGNYVLRYSAVDLTTGVQAPQAFNVPTPPGFLTQSFATPGRTPVSGGRKS